MAVTPDDQLRTMLDNLPEKTGRSLDEWMSVLAGREVEKFGKLVAWLKSEHGVTHGFANLIVHSLQKGGAAAPAVEDAGSFNGMVSHRVRLTDPGEVDEEVVAWLQEAYERAG